MQLVLKETILLNIQFPWINGLVNCIEYKISSKRFVGPEADLDNNSINMVESNIFHKFNTKKFKNIIFILDLTF